MAYVDTHDRYDPREALRWAICAAVVLLAHALVVLALLARPEDADTEAGAPVVMIELAPLAAAPPAPETDVAPGPQQLQMESREAAQEETPQATPQEVQKVPDLTPAANAAVTLPPPEPPKDAPQREAKQKPAEAAPVPTAPPPAVTPSPRPASPPPGRVPRPSSAALLSWQRSLVAHLERSKHYPPGANGQEGVARLAFRIDRSGRLITSRILQSSGSATLDQETLALVRRAQPFPAPPANVGDNELSFVVPIRYAASARR